MCRIIKPDASFTPRELFARMQGAWFEPRQGSMWQEHTGVTATTSGGQTIGLLLSLDQQQQIGPELVTNGTFYTDTTGWSVRGDATVTRSTTYFPGGSIKISVVNGDTGATQTLSGLTIGKLYEVSALAYAPSATNGVVNGAVISLAATPNETNALSAQVNAEDVQQQLFIRFFATTTSYTLYLYCLNRGVQWGYGGDSAYFANISVREILGNHASQATAANRPTLQFNGNLPLIRHADSTDVLVASMPNLGGGVFSSAGSVYFSTPSGMSCLHNQSIGTSYNLPALQTDIYGTVITPARLAPPLEQQLALYMHRLAGLADADFFWQEGYGPELVTNGGFSNGTTGWTPSAGSSISVVSGELEIANAGTYGNTYQAITTVAGKTYAISGYVRLGTTSVLGVYVGTVAGGTTLLQRFVSASFTYTFVASAQTTYITFINQTNTVGHTSYINNISVREILDRQVGQLLTDDGTILLRG